MVLLIILRGELESVCNEVVFPECSNKLVHCTGITALIVPAGRIQQVNRLKIFVFTMPVLNLQLTERGYRIDKRVKFDFEICFTNGGSLKGVEFQLDLNVEEISDKELADYLVTDLRLLMVKKAIILKKEEVNDEHKRKTDHNKTGSSILVDLKSHY